MVSLVKIAKVLLLYNRHILYNGYILTLPSQLKKNYGYRRSMHSGTRTIGQESILRQMLRVKTFIFYAIIRGCAREEKALPRGWRTVLLAQPVESIAKLDHLAVLNREIKRFRFRRRLDIEPREEHLCNRA